ncbi:hypothetical protein Cni_G00709 [Canna indica]|uniref:Transmembrane protein n=1 Tax=Canna indica TaxID=4628 RepID=A0AAQ3PXL0_9LILI|nr:hypothetical protein Cni_G00709 [Canna indica]
MCCPSKSCCICLLVVLVIIAIGFVFGFGIFAHGFNKIKNALHLEEGAAGPRGYPYGRRFYPGAAPPPF